MPKRREVAGQWQVYVRDTDLQLWRMVGFPRNRHEALTLARTLRAVKHETRVQRVGTWPK